MGFSIASYIKTKNQIYLLSSFCLSFMNSTSLLLKIRLGGNSGKFSAALKSKSD
jgi:hypothetical protein